ncbi:MAG: cyclic nucleotide-binding domain-containing protein [Anaerolineales bacterium]|nr:cyclic nucleotide-binding domain-containing protein [Anaerolineales bacterium]
MSDLNAFDKVSLLRLAFEGLADDELREMASLTRLCSYPPGHVLCREGANEEILYIIADGEAVITKRIGEQEGERTLRTVKKGEWVGEMALIQNAPRAATVCATTEVTALEMGKKDFEAMLSRSPSMAIDIVRTTLNRMRVNDQMAIRDLQHTNKILRQLDRNKLEFIQVAAHELRTPLTVLKGYVNLLKSLAGVKGDATINEVVDGIIKGADRMHEVVNMMLDVTRLDSETLKVIPAPILVKGMLHDVVSELIKAAEERNIEINIEHGETVSLINADPSLVQKALHHVIINAIKYTPDGGKITLSSRSVLMDNNEAGVEICVRDTGIGLDAEHHKLIFEKFYQVGGVAVHSSGKTTFKGGGPGLGLAIARGAVKAHGGKIWVESAGCDEDKFPGCAFYIQLPVNPLEKIF